MNKKLVISLSVVFGIFAVVLILLWTLFGLSSVTVKFHSTTKNLSVTEQEIIKVGDFRMHACVLFESKNRSIRKIEEYTSVDKRFAYVRVLNIETVFPNKFVIHIAERETLFAVEHSGQVYICDRDLRVLEILTSYESREDNAILLQGLTIKNDKISVGDFLNVEEEEIKKFYSAMQRNNRSFAEQISYFKSAILSTSNDELTGEKYFDLTLKTFSDDKFLIKNINFALDEKVQKMFAIQSAVYNQNVDADGNILDKDGNVIYLSKTENGEYIAYNNEYPQKYALTYQLLSKCYIKIDNLTLSDYVDRNKNDIYYAFVEE